jgi:hypothetical protein
MSEIRRRLDDDPVKSRISNLLGQIVLASIPLLAVAVFGAWFSGSTSIIKLATRVEALEAGRIERDNRTIKFFAEFERRLDLRVVQIEKTIDLLRQELTTVRDWSRETEDSRFRPKDAEPIIHRIAALEQDQREIRMEVRNHNAKAEGYIDRIIRNTKKMDEMSTKVHEHYKGAK